MIEFLTPVSKAIIAHRELLPKGTIGKQLSVHTSHEEFPDLTNVKVAIFGCKENRRDVNYMGLDIHFDTLRMAFYSLFPGNWKHTMVDLGDIEKGDRIEDSYFALKTVTASLLKKNIIPIIIGGSQDVLYAQYRAYDSIVSMINMVNIDTRFDLGDAEAAITNKSYVGKIIVDKPYNLFNYSVVGYQSFFNPPQEIALMEALYFDAHRLGVVTQEIKDVEPIFRNADLVTLDVSSIKSSELGIYTNENPNGFDGREICAISRYAGISGRVSSFSLFEMTDLTNSRSGAMLLAQVIWYFIEGVNFRVSDDDFKDQKSYTTYKVPIDDDILIFKKSNKTGRWWIELPFISNMNNKLKSSTLLPCTYGEYLSATNQEIPERWLKARRKNEV